MRKILAFILLFFFISGTFVGISKPISASDLVEDSWSAKTPMRHPRHNAGIVEVNGKIYVIGGYPRFHAVGTNERYDPVTDTWVTLKPMPTPRFGFVTATHEDKIYCIGGEYMGKLNSWNAVRESNAVEVYDTVTDRWSTKASAPFGGNTNLQVHIIDGKIFAIVGFMEISMYMYEPATDSWIKKAYPNPPNYGSSSVCIDGKIIVFCNFQTDDDKDYTRHLKVWVYDPVVDSWTEKTSFYQSLFPNSSVAIVDDKIILFGLEFLSKNSNTVQLGVLRYDLKTDTWRKGTSGPKEFYNTNLIMSSGGWSSMPDVTVATTGIYAPQRVYILWKQYGTTHLSNWVYSPTRNIWSTAKNMPSNPDDFSVVVIDDLIYVMGTNTNERYVPIGYRGATASSSSLNSTLTVASILIIGATAIVITLFFISKKRKQITGSPSSTIRSATYCY